LSAANSKAPEFLATTLGAPTRHAARMTLARSPATGPGQACVISGFAGVAGCASTIADNSDGAIVARRTIHRAMFILDGPLLSAADHSKANGAARATAHAAPRFAFAMG
jgi:hypothetical protein